MRLQPNSFLRLTVVSPTVGARVQANGLVLAPDGSLTPITVAAEVATADTAIVEIDQLTEGELLGLFLSAESGIARQGEAYAVAAVQIAGGSSNPRWVTLCAGWIPPAGTISFPTSPALPSAGPLGVSRERSFSDPAAGADWSTTLAGYGYVALETVRFRLVTDATAANRRVIVQAFDGSTPVWEAVAPAVQTASTTERYTFARGVTTGVDANERMMCALPFVGVREDLTLRTLVVNLQSGDQIDEVYTSGSEFRGDV